MSAQKHVCLIPARMGSSRYPNKPMINMLGMPMIGHIAMRCQIEPIFDLVAVATCDKEIFDYCKTIGVKAVMTSDKHERASDRIQEAARHLEKELGLEFASVTMVQGDEPLVTPSMLRAALEGLRTSGAKVVNLKSRITTSEEFRSPNCVKVVTDKKSNALYFSREPIPSAYRVKGMPEAYKQVCVIPFERKFLDLYSALEPTPLEIIESVDMMRVLENGYDVHCVEISEESYPVDVPADVERVVKHLSESPLTKKYLR